MVQMNSALPALLLVAILAVTQVDAFWPRSKPYVVGHRGACGYRPEHTMASYELAAQMGADFIECDVVLTKDLVPVCRHEPLLSGTTDADKKFPGLNRTILIDGANYTGVFSTDLTFAQFKTLRAKERLPNRNHSFDGLYDVPSLEEYIQFAQSYNRVLGIYPETKHPTWHDSLDIVKNADTSITDILIKMLHKYGYTGPLNSAAWAKKPVFIQSFESQNLRKAVKKTCIPMVFLMDDFTVQVPGEKDGVTYNDFMSASALKKVAQYASGIGPWMSTLLVADDLVTNGTEGSGLKSSGLVKRAHSAGLQLHPYTFRPEPEYLSSGNFTSIENEFERFVAQEGIDGAFTDTADRFVGYLKKKSTMEAGREWKTSLLNAGPKKNKKAATPNSLCYKNGA